MAPEAPRCELDGRDPRGRVRKNDHRGRETSKTSSCFFLSFSLVFLICFFRFAFRFLVCFSIFVFFNFRFFVFFHFLEPPVCPFFGHFWAIWCSETERGAEIDIDRPVFSSKGAAGAEKWPKWPKTGRKSGVPGHRKMESEADFGRRV